MPKTRRVPPLNALKAFEAVARLGGVALAAKEANVSPSAISQQLRLLESWLGVQLLARRPGGIELTDSGRNYLPVLTEAFDNISDATLGLLGETLVRPLKVACLPSFASEWLIPRLGDFFARYPGIKVEILTSNVLVNFNHDDVDIGIRFGGGIYPDAETELLIGERLAPVCHPALLEGKPVEDLRAFLSKQVLLHDQAGPQINKPSWPDWLEATGMTEMDFERGPRFTDTHMTMGAARRKQGVMLGRYVLVADSLADGSLCVPIPRWIDAKLAYYLVWSRHRSARPAVRKFRSWIKEKAAAMTLPDVADG